MSNEEKFSGKAGHYDSARPAYAEELLEALYSDCGISIHSVIADIGSGTGILTEQLLKRGNKVYGVEPNADMRAASEKRLENYNNFISVDGCASNTKLPDLSVDIVTAAQALHWFDIDKFKSECNRILKPNGFVVIVYNQRRNDIINERITDTTARYCDLIGAGMGKVFVEENKKRINNLFGGKFTEIAKSNPLYMDKEKFLSYLLSRSYAPRAGDGNYRSFVDGMTAIFNDCAKDGVITIEQDSVAYIGKVYL